MLRALAILTRFSRAAVAAVLFGCASLASAQDDDVQTPIGDLERLAEIIGSAHHLRQLCNKNDQTWRDQMLSLIEVEVNGDKGREHALAEAFNTGYTAAQKQRRRCDAQARQSEAQLAAEGRRLAEGLRNRYQH